MNQPGAALLSKSAVVVTGGGGFIGSHLMSRLYNTVRRLKTIDSLRYGTWKNLAVPVDPACLVHADLTNLTVDEMATQLEGYDVLLHFAAEKHNNAMDAPQRIIETNISSIARLFDAAGKVGMRNVVFASSLYAYGRLTGAPMREDDASAPATIYGVSKLAGEGLLREASNRYGFRHLSLRLFFVYGPRQFVGMGYPSVIVKNFTRILKGERPIIFGDGRQVLDYVFIDDVVRAVCAAAEALHSNEVINIGSGRGVSIDFLTGSMLHTARSDLAPVYAAPDWTAGTSRVSNPEKASKMLGFSAEIGLEEGLERVWSWIKRQAE
jgi:UDP-glucose 4-epimerase